MPATGMQGRGPWGRLARQARGKVCSSTGFSLSNRPSTHAVQGALQPTEQSHLRREGRPPMRPRLSSRLACNIGCRETSTEHRFRQGAELSRAQRVRCNRSSQAQPGTASAAAATCAMQPPSQCPPPTTVGPGPRTWLPLLLPPLRRKLGWDSGRLMRSGEPLGDTIMPKPCTGVRHDKS